MRVSLDRGKCHWRSRLYRSSQYWLYLSIGAREMAGSYVVSGELASLGVPPRPMPGVALGLIDHDRVVRRVMTDNRGCFEFPSVCGESLSLKVLTETSADLSGRVTLTTLGLR